MTTTGAEKSQKRQQKITKAFSKQVSRVEEEQDEELLELLEENQRLQEELDAEELRHFQLMRGSLPQPRPFIARQGSSISKEVSDMNHREVKLQAQPKFLEEKLANYLLLLGMQVKIFTSSQVGIAFEVCIDGQICGNYAIKLVKGAEDWEVERYHLPVGLNLSCLSRHDIMSEEYFVGLHTALLAYHKRLNQIQELKSVVPASVQIYSILNGSFVEIVLKMLSCDGDSEAQNVVLSLKYDPFKARPDDVVISRSMMDRDDRDLFELTRQFEPLSVGRLAPTFMKCIERNEENQFYCPVESQGQRNAPNRGRETRRSPVQQKRPNPWQAAEDDSEDDDMGYGDNMNVQTFVPKQRRQEVIQEESENSDDNGFSGLRQKSKSKKPSKKSGSFKVPLPPKPKQVGAKKKQVAEANSDVSLDDEVSSILTSRNTQSTHRGKPQRYQQSSPSAMSESSMESYTYYPERDEELAVASKKGKKTAQRAVANNDVATPLGKTSAFSSKTSVPSRKLPRGLSVGNFKGTPPVRTKFLGQPVRKSPRTGKENNGMQGLFKKNRGH